MLDHPIEDRMSTWNPTVEIGFKGGLVGSHHVLYTPDGILRLPIALGFTGGGGFWHKLSEVGVQKFSLTN